MDPFLPGMRFEKLGEEFYAGLAASAGGDREGAGREANNP
jgi:hypothetical protein